MYEADYVPYIFFKKCAENKDTNTDVTITTCKSNCGLIW